MDYYSSLSTAWIQPYQRLTGKLGAGRRMPYESLNALLPLAAGPAAPAFSIVFA
jgi:hypothetical protein